MTSLYACDSKYVRGISRQNSFKGEECKIREKSNFSKNGKAVISDGNLEFF